MKHYTKRAITWMMVLLLMVAAALPALGADKDLNTMTREELLDLGLNSPPRSIAMVGDTLYMYGSGMLFALKEGETTYTSAGQISPINSDYMESLEECISMYGDDAYAYVSSILAWEDTLYALNGLSGQMIPIDLAAGTLRMEEALSLPWDQMAQDYGYAIMVDMVMQHAIVGDTLYLLTQGVNEFYGKTRLTAFGLRDGSMREYQTQFMQSFTPYKEGKFLAMVYDQENAYDMMTESLRFPDLAVFDPAGDSLQVIRPLDDLGSHEIGGFAYDPGINTLYCAVPGKVMALPGLGAAQQVNYLPTDSIFWDNPVGLWKDIYVYGDYIGVYLRDTDPAAMVGIMPLTLYNLYPNSSYNKFIVEYPKVPLLMSTAYYNNAQDLILALSAGTETADILAMDVGFDNYSEVMNKGYCYDLSASAVIVEKLGAMYPVFRDAVTKDGKIYGVPVSFYGTGLGYAPIHWEEAGLSKAQLPTTTMDLLAFVKWWAEEGSIDNPDTLLMEGTAQPRDRIWWIIIGEYVAYYQSAGKTLTFDTALFRRLAAAFEAIDFTNITLAVSDYSEDLYELPYLFMEGIEVLSLYSVSEDPYMTPLPLPLDEGMEKNIPADLRVAFVNPYSKNLDMAVKYLEYQVLYPDDEYEITLYPGNNEPVLNPGYDQMMTRYKDDIERFEKQLETAAPEDLRRIGEEIAWRQDALNQSEEFKYQYSAEEIAAYRAVAEYIYVRPQSFLSMYADENAAFLRQLINRYKDGEMTIDQFIVEADRRLALKTMEEN